MQEGDTMSNQDRINIDTFKVVTRAIAESGDLGIMTNHLTQLLVGALEIRACTIFVLNWKTEELEILASFGLSVNYMRKGPVLAKESIGCTVSQEPIVVRDVTNTDRLQYPEHAKKEGIGGIVSLPIMFYGKPIGVLRLYHYEPWEISERDVESLQVLAEHIALAMMYTRLLNAAQSIKEITDNELLVEAEPLFRK